MKIFFRLCVVLLTLPLTVQADELLDRLESATELLSKHQAAFYVSRVPELKDKMPAWEWDDENRTASQCVLQGIETKKGRKVAEAYVVGIEKDAQLEITSMNQLSEQSSIPDELKGEDQTIYNLMESCKTLEISAIRLQESGLWDAMMDRTIMDRLMAE